MSTLSGYVDVKVTKIDETEEEVAETAGAAEKALEIGDKKTKFITQELRIDGAEFGLEEGGDWERDDDAWLCGYILKAFCDGFDATLSLRVLNDTVTAYTLSFGNLQDPVHQVTLLEDALDISQCLRSACVDE